jgi:hypothetical protein
MGMGLPGDDMPVLDVLYGGMVGVHGMFPGGGLLLDVQTQEDVFGSDQEWGDAMLLPDRRSAILPSRKRGERGWEVRRFDLVSRQAIWSHTIPEDAINGLQAPALELSPDSSLVLVGSERSEVLDVGDGHALFALRPPSFDEATVTADGRLSLRDESGTETTVDFANGHVEVLRGQRSRTSQSQGRPAPHLGRFDVVGNQLVEKGASKPAVTVWPVADAHGAIARVGDVYEILGDVEAVRSALLCRGRLPSGEPSPCDDKATVRGAVAAVLR